MNNPPFETRVPPSNSGVGSNTNNKPARIREKLSAATCSLLGMSLTAQAEPGIWDLSSTVLYYQESDGRVQALEPVVAARRDFGDDRYLNLKLTLDVLTGASPSGAVPSSTVQTFTRPSGKGSYTVAPGEIPLDDTFHDTRGAINAAWQQPVRNMGTLSFGGNLSAEYDYVSVGANGNFAFDFNAKNTTLSTGLALAFDSISPEGGLPTPFAAMRPANTTPARDKPDDSKTGVDVLVGVSQVINRNLLMQVNYALTMSDGYHTDPFKLVSVVDGTGEPQSHLFEKRPDSRARNSLFWQTKYYWNGDIVDGSYRYFWDDWGITAHTVDFHYRWSLGGTRYLEPHIRYYWQTAADFYTTHLRQGDPLPEFATADYRLADFTGTTLGIKMGWLRPNGTDRLSARLEVYQQTGKGNPLVPTAYDTYPDMTAIMGQLSFTF